MLAKQNLFTSLEEMLVFLQDKHPFLLSTKDNQDVDRHSFAFALYEKAHYKESAELFAELCFRDPFQKSFWEGLASSWQMLSSWNEAIAAWQLVSLLDETDSSSYFHRARCLFELEQKKQAHELLLIAEEKARAHEDPMLQNNIALFKELLA